MKWYQRQTNLRNDEGVGLFCDEFKSRLEAKGFLSDVMDLVAEKWDPEGDEVYPTVTHSFTHWSHCLHIHHHTLSKYMGKLGVIPWVTVECGESTYTVTIPRMLKWLDNHTRNLQATNKRLAIDQTRPEEK